MSGNGGQRWDEPVGLSSTLLTKPPVSLREKPPQTWWSWCVRTVMAHAADLFGHWVHSNNTLCMCLHPWDNLMRTYPPSADSGGRAAGCSCIHQGFNHSPVSAWRTQGSAVSGGILMALLAAAFPPKHMYTASFTGLFRLRLWASVDFTARGWKNHGSDLLNVCPHTARVGGAGAQDDALMELPSAEEWTPSPLYGLRLLSEGTVPYKILTRHLHDITSGTLPDQHLPARVHFDICVLHELKKIKFYLLLHLECSLVNTSGNFDLCSARLVCSLFINRIGSGPACTGLSFHSCLGFQLFSTLAGDGPWCYRSIWKQKIDADAGFQCLNAVIHWQAVLPR